MKRMISTIIVTIVMFTMFTFTSEAKVNYENKYDAFANMLFVITKSNIEEWGILDGLEELNCESSWEYDVEKTSEPGVYGYSLKVHLDDDTIEEYWITDLRSIKHMRDFKTISEIDIYKEVLLFVNDEPATYEDMQKVVQKYQ